MLSSLFTFLGGVVALGIWHGVLVSLRGEPGWVRSVLRVVLIATTVVQAVAYVIVSRLTHRVELDLFEETLNQVATWTAVADGTSAILLFGGFVLLAIFTARRVLRGPILDVFDRAEETGAGAASTSE